MTSDRPDAALVDAANAGDADAFAELYERYCDWAAAVALRFTNDPESARDVTHDAFIWLLSKFPGFELRAQVKTVLYPVVRNIALTGNRRSPFLPLDDDAAIESVKTANPDTELLRVALQQLPVGQREVILLRFADELSLAEISQALAIPLGTVKS